MGCRSNDLGAVAQITNTSAGTFAHANNVRFLVFFVLMQLAVGKLLLFYIRLSFESRKVSLPACYVLASTKKTWNLRHVSSEC